MYLADKIEDAIWSVAAQVKRSKEIIEQAWILDNALEPFSVRCFPRYNATHKQTKVYGLYNPVADEAIVELKQREGMVINQLGGKKLTQFLFDVNCTAQHELIHKYQWLHRDDGALSKNYDSKSGKQQYLGNLDEIETQAHDAAMEIRFFYPDLDPREVLKGYFVAPEINLPSVNGYMRAFKDPRHPVFKKFLQKTFGWLDHVSVQRPITYRLKE